MPITLFLLAMILSAIPASSQQVSLEIEGNYYPPGGVVRIYGTTDPGANISLVVTSSLGEVLLNITMVADTVGNYTFDFTLETDAPPGIYTVSVSIDDEVETETFTVILSALETLTEQLIEVANNSRLQVEKEIQRLNETGLEILGKALEHYEEGLEALNESLEELGKGEFDDAIEEAMEALRSFKKALLLLSVKAPKVRGEEEAERIRGLEVAIERAYEFLERVEELAEDLMEREYDVSDIEGNLTEAYENLENATMLVEEGEVDGAARELGEAREILGRTWAQLHTLMSSVRMNRVERFMNHTQIRIEALKRRLEALRDRIPEEDVEECLEALQNVEKRLRRIRGHITFGELEEALEELEETSEDIEEALEEVEGRWSIFLSEVDRLQAKMLMLNHTARFLMKKGLDISEFEEEMEEMEDEMEEIMERLRERKERIEEVMEEVIERRREIRKNRMEDEEEEEEEGD